VPLAGACKQGSAVGSIRSHNEVRMMYRYRTTIAELPVFSPSRIVPMQVQRRLLESAIQHLVRDLNSQTAALEELGYNTSALSGLDLMGLIEIGCLLE
jgi:hypothetical protein